ncbi:MAG TPA: Asp-tRNA(Asn)/Glu-tRNA(Gln) amidotransferase subunit GatC [Candidatus Paceibacterota bacterium]|nr:Asp-tRNA(Asn)/Glu-tRNA(Gln) amidotransferase subunit GatC [Candidatus Paceibacterota bacterium]
MNLIDKKTVKKLAELARMDINPREEESLVSDLERILEYFDELKELDTKNVLPMSGGTFLENIVRDDGKGERLPGEKSVDQFPEKERGFLKVPPVFE